VAKPAKPKKVKLFTGIIFPAGMDISPVLEILTKKFGDTDLQSDIIEFDHTEYYSEMGGRLVKKFISFRKLIEREKIASIKIKTNKIEGSFMEGGCRRVNLDPGYQTLSNVFLASCKDFFHRVYLKKGVFLENEYYYSNKKYRFWDWTYPDYRKEEYLDFFYKLRKIYHGQLKEIARG